MGAWGAGHFENDDALDLLGELKGLETLSALFAGLPPAGEGELEAPEASQAMAAAEVVAAMTGNPSADCPEAVTARLADLGAPSPELLEAAREAVSRVLFESELLELWADSDESEAWNLTVTDLIDRLNPKTKAKARQGKKKASAPSVICSFCREPVEASEGISVSVRSLDDDPINHLDQTFCCHLRCFNGKLDPRALIQRWTFDPDDPSLQAEVDKLLGNTPRGDSES
ncbi:MAG: DUF4259 domain-containing protein [Pseudomonadota bacterium]